MIAIGRRRSDDESRFGSNRLYRDAGSMATSSLANAVLGMLFWALAAKLYPPPELGVMTAVLSVVTAAGGVVASGIGDAYSALMPAVGTARIRVYRRGQATCIVLALIAGVGCAAATVKLLTLVHGSLVVAAIVAAGVPAWALFTLQNFTLGSLGRARWLPAANSAASLVKIVLLVLLAYTMSAHAVEVSTVLSALAGVAILTPRIRRLIASSDGLPAESVLTSIEAMHEFNRFVPRSMTAVVFSLGLFGLAPFLVTAYAGPSQGALYALCASIVLALDFVGQAMGSSLSVHASSAPEEAVGMARAVMLRTAAVIGVGGVVATLSAPLVLQLLSRQYGDMRSSAVLATLCAGIFLRVPYMVWAALQRVRRNMGAVLLNNLFAAALFIVAVPTLAQAHGAFGGAVALAAGQALLSVGAGVHVAFLRHGRSLGSNAQQRRHVQRQEAGIGEQAEGI